jgi:hypothetical protein
VRRRGGDGWGSRGDGDKARAGAGMGAGIIQERRLSKLGARQRTTPSSSSSLLDSDRESRVCKVWCVAADERGRETARGAGNSWSPWHRADVGKA